MKRTHIIIIIVVIVIIFIAIYMYNKNKIKIGDSLNGQFKTGDASITASQYLGSSNNINTTKEFPPYSIVNLKTITNGRGEKVVITTDGWDLTGYITDFTPVK